MAHLAHTLAVIRIFPCLRLSVSQLVTLTLRVAFAVRTDNEPNYSTD